MKYPKYHDYHAMYEKYINLENMRDMMDLAGDYKGKFFLDLCCGDGAAAREAVMVRGAEEALLVDQEKDMLASDLHNRDNMPILNYSIEEFLYLSKGNERFHGILKELTFDIVFCRQGINYWYKPKLMKQLAEWMNPDSVFIFNTFNTKPSDRPTVKEYKIENRSFAEISYLVADCIVHHVQVSEGYPPHLTQFKWLSERDFKDGLTDNFNYEIRRKKNTDIYICRKI